MSSLSEILLAIGLRYASQNLDDLIAMATKKRWGPAELLEHVAEEERKERLQRSLERRLTRSRIGRFKPMADFDWHWPKKIDRAAVESALSLDFLADARNVVLVAAHGLGKTMIAQNIAYNALQSGHTPLFTTASQMLLDLGSQDSARALDRRLKYYASKVNPLLIDEVGYLSYENRSADLLYQVISRRYESKSLVLSTNLAFSDWPRVFPNAASAIALIDRVIHHSEIIAIEGESYRKRQAEEAKRERKAKRRPVDS